MSTPQDDPVIDWGTQQQQPPPHPPRHSSSSPEHNINTNNHHKTATTIARSRNSNNSSFRTMTNNSSSGGHHTYNGSGGSYDSSSRGGASAAAALIASRTKAEVQLRGQQHMQQQHRQLQLLEQSVGFQQPSPRSLTALAIEEGKQRYVEQSKKPAPPRERRIVPRFNIVSPNILLPGELNASAPEFRLTPGVVPPLQAQARHLIAHRMVEAEERMLAVQAEASKTKHKKEKRHRSRDRGGDKGRSSSSSKKIKNGTSGRKPGLPPEARIRSSSPKSVSGGELLLIREKQQQSTHQQNGATTKRLLPPMPSSSDCSKNQTNCSNNNNNDSNRSPRVPSPSSSAAVVVIKEGDAEQHQQKSPGPQLPIVVTRQPQQHGAIEQKALECMRFSLLSDLTGSPVGVSMAGQTLNPTIGFDTSVEGSSSSSSNGGASSPRRSNSNHNSLLDGRHMRPRCVAALFSLRHGSRPGSYVIEWDGGTCRGVHGSNTTVKQQAKKFVVAAVKQPKLQQVQDDDEDAAARDRDVPASSRAERRRSSTSPNHSPNSSPYSSFRRASTGAHMTQHQQQQQHHNNNNHNSSQQTTPASRRLISLDDDGNNDDEVVSEHGGGEQHQAVVSPTNKKQHGQRAKNSKKKTKQQHQPSNDDEDQDITVMMIPSEDLTRPQQQQRRASRSRSPEQQQQQPHNHNSNLTQDQQQQQRRLSTSRRRDSSVGDSPSDTAATAPLTQAELDCIGAEWEIIQIIYQRRGASHEVSAALTGVPLHTIMYSPRVALRNIKFGHRVLVAVSEKQEQQQQQKKSAVPTQEAGDGNYFYLSTRHIRDPMFRGADHSRGEAELPSMFTLVVDAHFVDQFQRSLKKAFTDTSSSMVSPRRRGIGNGFSNDISSNKNSSGGSRLVERPSGEASLIAGMPPASAFAGPGPDFAGVTFGSRSVVVTMDPCLPPSTVLYRITETFIDDVVADELHLLSSSSDDVSLTSRGAGASWSGQRQQRNQQQQHQQEHYSRRPLLSPGFGDTDDSVAQNSAALALNSSLGCRQSWRFYNDDANLTMVVTARFRGFEESAISTTGTANLIGLPATSPNRDGNTAAAAATAAAASTTPARDGNATTTTGTEWRRHVVTELELHGRVPPGATVHFFRGFVVGEVSFAFDAF